MEIRKLPASRGLDWFKQSVNLGARNPRAVFGASLLLIVVLYLVALLALLPAISIAKQDQTPALGSLLTAVAPVFLVVVFLVPILIGGLMHVIREAEAGRPVRALDLFAPFRQRKAGSLAMLGVIQLVLGLIGGVIMVSLAGADYWKDYLAALSGALSGRVPITPQPDNPMLMLLANLVFNYFSYAIMLLAVPLILFAGRSLGDAVKDSLRASVRNIGANLLAAVLFVGGLVVATLLLMLLAMLVSAIAGLIHKALAGLLVAVIFLVFAAVVLVVLVGGAYVAWRDTFGDEAAPGTAVVDSIEL
ncbi:MAG: BPSS1780 family membrane protein [Luteimonas sp.]